MARATACLAATFRTSPLAVLETLYTIMTIVEIKVQRLCEPDQNVSRIDFAGLPHFVWQSGSSFMAFDSSQRHPGGILLGAVYTWCWCLHHRLYRGHTQQDVYLLAVAIAFFRKLLCLSYNLVCLVFIIIILARQPFHLCAYLIDWE